MCDDDDNTMQRGGVDRGEKSEKLTFARYIIICNIHIINVVYYIILYARVDFTLSLYIYIVGTTT